MGYGIIGITGKKIRLLSLGVLKLNKVEGQALKLKNIFEQTFALIEEYHPDELAIEAPFYGKNVQSMLNWEEPRAWQSPLLYPGQYLYLNILREK